MSPVFLKNITINSAWQPFLTRSNTDLLKKIGSQVIIHPFTPDADRVLRFLEFPLDSAKIIILGQDPYPQKGAATGRAFEVGNLSSWDQSFRNISLKNILRAVYKAYTGEVINYTGLKKRLASDFPVLPPGELFTHWEKQGVLLLNTSFTCEPGNPGSHRSLWNTFTVRLLSFINEQAGNAVWFLWGKHATEASGHLKLKNHITVMHPMMCFNKPSRRTDFLYGEVNCFERFADAIDWTGYNPPGVNVNNPFQLNS
jgi:uracil-DNA glycosylase